MTMLASIKHVLKQTLPRDLVFTIKKVRHATSISRVTMADEPDFRPLHSLVKPGDTVIDLGANMGYYTKYFSDLVGSTGMVYSIEPIPRTVKILSYVVRKLGLTNVDVINCAISDANQKVTMEIPLFADGEENIFEAKIVNGSADPRFERVEVESRTLDSLAGEIRNRVSFIKCDIEGHELQGLKGAARILAETKPGWLIEIWGNPDDAGSKAAETFAVFARAGYEAFWFDGKHMRRRMPGETSVNYFFLTQSHLPVLREHRLLADGAAG